MAVADQNYLRVRLPNGEARHVLLAQNAHLAQELENFENGQGQYTTAWLRTTEGTIVRREAIVEAAIVTLGGKPGWPWPNEQAKI
jgi:hypothetical protein